MELIRIKTWTQLQTVKNEWAHILESNQNSNPFIEFEWVSLWIECFERDQDIDIIGVLDGDAMIGFFPFTRTRTPFGSMYEMIGRGQSNYMDVVILHDRLAETIEMVFDRLLAEEPQLLFNLHGLLESSPTFEVLEAYLVSRNLRHSIHRVVTPYINLDKIQMDKYLTKRKKLHRLERREKRLHLLGKVEHRFCTPDELELIFQLHDKRWKKKSDTSGFTDEAGRKFYKKLFQLEGDRLKTIVDALYIEGKMIAFDYGFSCGNRYLSYVLGYDDDFESFSPGRMLEKESIIGFVNSEITIFDLSIGYEPYKFEWNTHLDYTARFIFSSNGFRASFFRRLLSGKGKLVERLKENRKTVLFKRDTVGYAKYVARQLFQSSDRQARFEKRRKLLRQGSSFIWKKERSFIMRKDVERPRKPGLGEGFNELQLNEAIYDERFNGQDLKLICTKLYGGYQAYYRTDGKGEQEIIWTNRKVLRLESIPYIKELRKNAIWLERWNLDNLAAICRFVNKEHLINAILLEVEAWKEDEISRLKEEGFKVERIVSCTTKLGKKQMSVSENGEN